MIEKRKRSADVSPFRSQDQRLIVFLSSCSEREREREDLTCCVNLCAFLWEAHFIPSFTTPPNDCYLRWLRFEIVTLSRLFVYVPLSSRQSPPLSAEQDTLVLVMPGWRTKNKEEHSPKKKRKRKGNVLRNTKCQGDRRLIYLKSNFSAVSRSRSPGNISSRVTGERTWLFELGFVAEIMKGPSGESDLHTAHDAHTITLINTARMRFCETEPAHFQVEAERRPRPRGHPGPPWRLPQSL